MRCHRRGDGDKGLTLIEMLITISVSVILLGAIGLPLILGLQTTQKSSDKLKESNDAELLAVRLPADLQSVAPQPSACAFSNPAGCSPGISTASGVGTGCAADSISPGSTNVIRLQWTEAVGATPNYSVSYRLVTVGTEISLVRFYCSGSSLGAVAPDTSYVARNLSATPIAVLVSGTGNREVTLTLQGKSGYTYSVRGFRRTP